MTGWTKAHRDGPRRNALLDHVTPLPAVRSQFDVAIDRALRSLVEVESPAELVSIANMADALRLWARRARLGMEAQNKAALVRLHAEYRIGDYLAQTDRHGGGRPSTKPVPAWNGFSPATLQDLGVDRKLSSRAQRLAAIPFDEFDDLLKRAIRADWELTARWVLNVAEHSARRRRNLDHIAGGTIADLHAFAAAGNRMGCILLDPPWPIPGVQLPYPTMDLDELRSLPIPELADRARCHLHIWVIAGRICRIVYELVEHWGFRVVSEFVWKKPGLGSGNYYRLCHETCLIAVWADREDRFDHKGLPSCIEFPRGPHSAKPDQVRQMIEQSSPGPRLELFARKRSPGWYSWGHEIAEPLKVQ